MKTIQQIRREVKTLEHHNDACNAHLLSLVYELCDRLQAVEHKESQYCKLSIEQMRGVDCLVAGEEMALLHCSHVPGDMWPSHDIKISHHKDRGALVMVRPITSTRRYKVHEEMTNYYKRRKQEADDE